MLQFIENALSKVALTTAVCTLGLSVVIATAGVTSTKLSFKCNGCDIKAELQVPRRHG